MIKPSEFVAAIPVLSSTDVDASVSFFEERLGFECIFRASDYAGVKRDRVELHFALCEPAELTPGTACRVAVRGIDALHAEYRKTGVLHGTGDLLLRDWGEREFEVLDNCGNIITFAEDAGAA